MNTGQREVLYALVGRASLGLDRWRTSIYLRLAHAGSCPAYRITFRSGLNAVADAFHHMHAAPACCRTLVHQIEQPAWEAEQARLRRRGESTHWRSYRWSGVELVRVPGEEKLRVRTARERTATAETAAAGYEAEGAALAEDVE